MIAKKFKLNIKKKTLVLIDWANVYGWHDNLGWDVDPKKLFNYLNRPQIIDRRFYYGVELRQEKSEAFKKEIEAVGFNFITKEVKWTPVFLEKQHHFKKIVRDLFNLLDKVKNTNSELSNKLYSLTKKIDSLPKISIGSDDVQFSLSNEKALKEIFESIEDLDGNLKDLNFDIEALQTNLKQPVSRRKCDFDVEITRDALSMVDNYETLLLFSGDGDYAALAKYLIDKGKKVIVVYAPGNKGREYVDLDCSLFFACTVEKLRYILQK